MIKLNNIFSDANEDMLLADWHYMDTRERQGKQIHLNSKPPGKRAEENCLIEKYLFFRPLTLLLTFDEEYGECLGNSWPQKFFPLLKCSQSHTREEVTYHCAFSCLPENGSYLFLQLAPNTFTSTSFIESRQ